MREKYSGARSQEPEGTLLNAGFWLLHTGRDGVGGGR